MIVTIKEGERPTADRAASEAAILSREYRLLVYESREYVGIPDGLPQGAKWADVSFQFRTHLAIVESR